MRNQRNRERARAVSYSSVVAASALAALAALSFGRCTAASALAALAAFALATGGLAAASALAFAFALAALGRRTRWTRWSCRARRTSWSRWTRRTGWSCRTRRHRRHAHRAKDAVPCGFDIIGSGTCCRGRRTVVASSCARTAHERRMLRVHRRRRRRFVAADVVQMPPVAPAQRLPSGFGSSIEGLVIRVAVGSRRIDSSGSGSGHGRWRRWERGKERDEQRSGGAEGKSRLLGHHAVRLLGLHESGLAVGVTAMGTGISDWNSSDVGEVRVAVGFVPGNRGCDAMRCDAMRVL